MRFTATFLGFVLLLPGALARPSIRESCGTDAQVIDKKTLVTSSGKELTFTTRLCPGFAALRNATTTPSTVRKRQIEQCSPTGTCECRAYISVLFLISFTGSSVECDTQVLQPSVSDCDTLTNELISLNEIFALLPGQAVEVYYGTCFYEYGNSDTVTYDVCTSSFVCFTFLI